MTCYLSADRSSLPDCDSEFKEQSELELEPKDSITTITRGGQKRRWLFLTCSYRTLHCSYKVPPPHRAALDFGLYATHSLRACTGCSTFCGNGCWWRSGERRCGTGRGIHAEQVRPAEYDVEEVDREDADTAIAQVLRRHPHTELQASPYLFQCPLLRRLTLCVRRDNVFHFVYNLIIAGRTLLIG